jgi:hypothetical protein
MGDSTGDGEEAVMHPPLTGWRTASHAAMAVLFLTGVFLPLVGQLCGARPASEQMERRRAAPWPQIDVRWHGPIPWPRKRTWQTFPDAFEAYYNDHFGFRRSLIRHYNLAVVHGVMPSLMACSAGKARPEAPALVGKNGWLFCTKDEDIETYRCARPFSPQQLDAWTRVLQERQTWLAQRGIRYLFVVPPSKPAVYPEYLPRAIQRVSPCSRVEELEICLREHGAAGLLLNLQPGLWAAKGEHPRHPLFYRTDTHWNQLGGYIGYRELMQRLQEWYPAATPRPLTEFEVSQHEGAPLVLAELLDTAELFSDTHVVLTPHRVPQAKTVEMSQATKDGVEHSISENPAAPLGHAVVLHDSFMVAMQPLLNEHWRQVHYFWTREFPCETIERLRPDIVIQEMAEFFVTIHDPKNPSPLQLPAESVRWAKGSTYTRGL